MNCTPAAPITVIGGGGHAKVIVGLIQALGVEIAAIRDENPEVVGMTVLGVPVEHPSTEASTEPRVLAVGDNRARAVVAKRVRGPFATLIHPAAFVAPDAELGPGTVVCAGAVIQPGAHVGSHVVVNTGSTIDHDCRIGDYVHLAPGVNLAGEVTVEEGAFLGVGSAVVNGLVIGAWATLGAGAVATRNIEATVTAVGTPARPLRRTR
ncbi:MAG: transferase [Acidobacteria bacterium]|nr:transferase [Acidobacteriota bacterium]